MNRLPVVMWPIVLAFAVAMGGRMVWAGDVTVVGSPWHERPIANADQISFQEEVSPPLSELPNIAIPDQLANSSLYTRIDYLHWGEPRQGNDPTVESGALYTLGYVRRMGVERFRGELFYGNTRFNSFATIPVTTLDPASNLPITEDRTFHLTGDGIQFGGRAEYEYIWDVTVDCWPPVSFFAGIGTRIWNRTIFDLQADSGETFFDDSQLWWTIYPYVGAERRWALHSGGEFFAKGRIGATVVNYCRAQWPDEPAYYPRPGITGQLECGLCRGHLDFAICFEAMSWNSSNGQHVHGDPTSQLFCWPATQMYTTGLKLGWSF